MKRKEIKIGESYAVYIDRTFLPHGKLDYGSKESTAVNPQVAGGVPKRYVAKHHVFEGTVVAIDVPRWISASTYYNNYKIENDGILVELKKPITRRDETIKFIVVRPMHVLQTWKEEKADRAEQAKAEKRYKNDREQAVKDRAANAEYYRSLGLEVEDPTTDITSRDWSKVWDVEWSEYNDLSGSIKVTEFGVAKLIEMVNGYKQAIELHWSPSQAEEMNKLVLARAIALIHVEEDEEEVSSDPA